LGSVHPLHASAQLVEPLGTWTLRVAYGNGGGEWAGSRVDDAVGTGQCSMESERKIFTLIQYSGVGQINFG